MRLKTWVWGMIIFLLVITLGHQSATSDENLYTIHTKSGNIQCNYHNSRDLNNGFMGYYNGGEQKYIEYWKVDSITIHSQNFWTCGPVDKKMKYIDKRVK